MTVKEEAKRIPYGMMNFVAVREDNCYYVDKTRFIEKVEKANKFFFFIRPRRFGKSLTMSICVITMTSIRRTNSTVSMATCISASIPHPITTSI